MRKAALIILGLLMLVLAAPLAYGEVSRNDFRYSSHLTASKDGKAGFFILELDPKVYAAMDTSFPDLRIYGKDGQERGYSRLQLAAPAGETSYQGLEIINKGTLEGSSNYSFTVKNIPADINEMRVKLDQPEYLVKARISGSNDNRTWQFLGVQTLYGINDKYNTFSLSGIDFGYLKFEYPVPGGETLAINEVGYTTVKEAAPQSQATPLAIKQTDRNKVTTIEMDLGYKNQNSSAVKLITADKNFYRPAYLEASNDRKNWQQVSSFYLYRGTDEKDENLGGYYPLIQARYLKITVENGDNVPVRFTSATAELENVKLLVKDSGAGGAFTVYWGNAALNPPAYDIDQILQQGEVDLANLPEIVLDSYSINAQYKQPKPPLTERYPFLLPLALAIAVIIVGIIQFRSFKHVEK